MIHSHALEPYIFQGDEKNQQKGVFAARRVQLRRVSPAFQASACPDCLTRTLVCWRGRYFLSSEDDLGPLTQVVKVTHGDHPSDLRQEIPFGPPEHLHGQLTGVEITPRVVQGGEHLPHRW